MNFSLTKTLEVLQRTPVVLHYLLDDLSPDWTTNNEGPGTWSAYDIIGHLIHGEKTDWIPRAEIILSGKENKEFEPFDRFAQFENSKGKSLTQLIQEFAEARRTNIERLRSLNISDEDLCKTGIHPTFGEVTLSQLLSTWAVHDLDHLSQVTRVMAKQYKEETGPWIEFLKILRQ